MHLVVMSPLPLDRNIGWFISTSLSIDLRSHLYFSCSMSPGARSYANVLTSPSPRARKSSAGANRMDSPVADDSRSLLLHSSQKRLIVLSGVDTNCNMSVPSSLKFIAY